MKLKYFEIHVVLCAIDGHSPVRVFNKHFSVNPNPPLALTPSPSTSSTQPLAGPYSLPAKKNIEKHLASVSVSERHKALLVS